MSGIKISELPAAGSVNGTEIIPVVQSGVTKRMTGTSLVGQFFDAQAHGWVADNTDHSTEALALLTTVKDAGGGVIYFRPSLNKYRADSQLLIPNDGAGQPSQVDITLMGAGAGHNWYNQSASVLDLRYQATDGNAKIETRGKGTLRIEGLTITDGSGVNVTPFIHSTNTVLLIRNSTFIGSGVYVNDSHTTSGSPTVTSATAGFTAAMLHKQVKGTNIPVGTYVGVVNSSSSIGLSSSNSSNVAVNASGTTVVGTLAIDAGQDAIVLGGVNAVGPDGTLGSMFQGYGTVIDSNHFRQLNRGLYCLTDANAVVFAYNSFQGNTGSRAVESDGTNGFPDNSGLCAIGNVIEMDMYSYGFVLTKTSQFTLVGNTYYDQSGDYVVSLHLIDSNSNGICLDAGGGTGAGAPVQIYPDATGGIIRAGDGTNYMDIKSGGVDSRLYCAGNRPFIIFANGNEGLRVSGTGLVSVAHDFAGADGYRIYAAGSGSTMNVGSAGLSNKVAVSCTDLGFYATSPVAQQVLATGAGKTVDNVITALQNLGLVKQS